MSFTSLIFLLCFLPFSLALYYIVPDRVKEYVLLGISLLFYAIGSLQFLPMFLIAVIVTVAIGRALAAQEKLWLRRAWLVFGILCNAGMLIYYKYMPVWMEVKGNDVSNWILPLGISFYTFKAISYLADVYRGQIPLKKNGISDALYLSVFTQIQSGPISRYADFERVAYPETEKQWALFEDGVTRFMKGFCKKVLIADVLTKISEEAFSLPMEDFSTAFAWLGSICFSLQLYYDFAGYSDMAIGLSEMFGYRCMENFQYPYMTESVSGFWKRWHISLSQWFRDYVYIPLGGSRKGNVYFNLLVVWLLTGIWHGTGLNFLAWGIGYFVVIAFERLSGLPGKCKTVFGRMLYRLFTLLFINFEWVLFRANGLRAGTYYLREMLTFQGNEVADKRVSFLLNDYLFFLIVAVLFCLPIRGWLHKLTVDRPVWSKILACLETLGIVIAFIWAVSFVVAGQNNPFLYANF